MYPGSRGEQRRAKEQIILFRARMRQFGFLVPEKWSYREALVDCVNKLNTTALSTFTLVLPPTFYVYHDHTAWY